MQEKINDRPVLFFNAHVIKHMSITLRLCHTHHSFRYYHPDSQWRPFSMNLSQCSPETMSRFSSAEILPPLRGHRNRHRIPIPPPPPPEWCWNKRHNLSHITVALTGSPSGCSGEQWCSIRLTAPRTTWLTLSNRGFCKPGLSRRALPPARPSVGSIPAV